MSKFKSKWKTILCIDTLALGAIHVINESISSSALLKNILKPQTGKYYHWKMGDIFYQKSGSGAPLLLIHDLDSFASGYEWNLLIDQLQLNHTVYTLDLLGCGRSSKPGITYTNYLYVQLLSDFIREIIGEKTDLAVTGLSSSFVLMTALAVPDLIGKITMINPPSLNLLDQMPNEKSRRIRTIMNLPIIGTAIYHIKTSHQRAEYAVTEKYLYNPFHSTQKLIDSYYEAAHYGHGGGKYLMASLDGFYLNANLRKALSGIEHQILIIYSDKLKKEKEIVNAYQKLNTQISAVAVTETKYLPHLEKPEEICKNLTAFL